MATRRTTAGNERLSAVAMLRGVGLFCMRFVTATVFIYAGLVKLRSPQAFADSIATFQLLPTTLIVPLAVALPIFEFSTGLWLFSGRKLRTGAFCGLTASTVFLLALLSAQARGLPVECGCFGGSAPSSLPPARRLWLDIGRDLLLVGALAVIYLDALHQKRGRLPSSR